VQSLGRQEDGSLSLDIVLTKPVSGVRMAYASMHVDQHGLSYHSTAAGVATAVIIGFRCL